MSVVWCVFPFFFKLSSKVVLQIFSSCRCHSIKPKFIWANIANVGQSYFCKCPWVKRRNCGVLFQFREVSWEGAATVETIYFWHLTLKLTLSDASGPTEQTQQQQSASTSSQESWTRCITDWGSQDTVSALMDFIWARGWCHSKDYCCCKG